MLDDIKLILNKIIYDELELNTVEEQLVKKGIRNKNIYNPDGKELASKYFFLLNDIHYDNLLDSEKRTLEDLYNKSLKDDKQAKEDLYNFLNQVKLKLLIPNSEVKYEYFGIRDFEHTAPTDAIVLGFHYIRYNRENFDDESDRNNEYYITDMVNNIQFNLAKNKSLKVAVLTFDEVNKDIIRKI